MQAAADVQVVDGIAYVADFAQGLVTVDVSPPDAPVVLDAEWVLGSPDSVAVHGKQVFLGAGLFGVSQVDASDPAALTWVNQIVPGASQPPAAIGRTGSREDPSGSGVTVVDVSVSGNYLVIADAGRPAWIYSADPGGAVTPVGSYAALVPIEDTAVHGATLYVTDGSAAMEIADLSATGTPQRLTIVHGRQSEVAARYGYDMIVERRPSGRIAVTALREMVRGGEDDGDDDDDDGDDHGDDDDDDHEGGGCHVGGGHHEHEGGHGGHGGEPAGHDDDDDDSHGGRGADGSDRRGGGGHGH